MDITMLIFMAWILNISLAAYLAKQRGRNPITWGILGFLGGLIACFIVFILPKKENPLPNLTSILPVNGTVWYYLDHRHTQHGPMSYQTLLRHQKDISHVWNETMKDWNAWGSTQST